MTTDNLFAVDVDLLARLQGAGWAGEPPSFEDRAGLLGAIVLWARSVLADPGLHAIPRCGGWVAVTTYMQFVPSPEPTEMGAYVRAVEHYRHVQEMRRAHQNLPSREVYDLMQRFLGLLILRVPSLVFSTSLELKVSLLFVEYDSVLQNSVVSWAPNTGTVTVTIPPSGFDGSHYVDAEWSGLSPSQAVARVVEFFANRGILPERGERDE